MIKSNVIKTKEEFKCCIKALRGCNSEEIFFLKNIEIPKSYPCVIVYGYYYQKGFFKRVFGEKELKYTVIYLEDFK